MKVGDTVRLVPNASGSTRWRDRECYIAGIVTPENRIGTFGIGVYLSAEPNVRLSESNSDGSAGPWPEEEIELVRPALYNAVTV